jgi:hypothetical protein
MGGGKDLVKNTQIAESHEQKTIAKPSGKRGWASHHTWLSLSNTA